MTAASHSPLAVGEVHPRDHLRTLRKSCGMDINHYIAIYRLYSYHLQGFWSSNETSMIMNEEVLMFGSGLKRVEIGECLVKRDLPGQTTVFYRSHFPEKPGGKPSVSTPVQPSSIFCQGQQVCHKNCRPSTFENHMPIFKKTGACNYLPNVKMKLM